MPTRRVATLNCGHEHLGTRPRGSTEAREQSVAENDDVWQLTQLAGVCGETLRAEGDRRPRSGAS